MAIQYIASSSAVLDLFTFTTTSASAILSTPAGASAGDIAIMQLSMGYFGGDRGSAEYYYYELLRSGWNVLADSGPGNPYNLVWYKRLSAGDLGAQQLLMEVNGYDDHVAMMTVYRGIRYQSVYTNYSPGANGVLGFSGLLLGGTPVLLTGGFASGLSGGGARGWSKQRAVVDASPVNIPVDTQVSTAKALIGMAHYTVEATDTYSFSWAGGAANNVLVVGGVTPALDGWHVGCIAGPT